MRSEQSAADLVAALDLLPHPEGGYYRETYRSAGIIPATALEGRFPGERVFSTAIYFLLEQGNFSAFHRIRSDECWHFYSGDALLVHLIHPDGRYERLCIGKRPSAGQAFQGIVPAGCWFASETIPGGAYSLVGCTVAPGFDFADFELARREDLVKLFPQHETLITRLCR